MHSIISDKIKEIDKLKHEIEDLKIEIKAKDEIINNYLEKVREFQDKDNLIASLNMDIYML